MHDPADHAWIEPLAALADEQRRPGLAGDQPRPAGREPGVDGPHGRLADGHAPLLAALAEHPYDPAVPVEVAEIEPAQLGDPDAGGVQQLEDGDVPRGPRSPALLGSGDRLGQHRRGVAALQGRRQRAHRFGDRSAAAGSPPADPSPGPSEEHPDSRGPSLQRPPRPAAGLLLGQPAAQRPEVGPDRSWAPSRCRWVEQADQVAPVGPHGVGRQSRSRTRCRSYVVMHRPLQRARQSSPLRSPPDHLGPATRRVITKATA